MFAGHLKPHLPVHWINEDAQDLDEAPPCCFEPLVEMGEQDDRVSFAT